MHPTKNRDSSAWPKSKYQHWVHFQQSLRSKINDGSQQIELVDPGTEFPQPRISQKPKPAESLLCVYPKFDSLQPEDIFSFMGSFGADTGENRSSQEPSSSVAKGNNVLLAKRANPDPLLKKNKKKSAGSMLPQEPREPTPTSPVKQEAGGDSGTSASPAYSQKRDPPQITPMRQAMIAEHNRKSGGTTASSQQLSESPGIDAPPLPGANSIPLVKKPAVNPVMARMQQQKPKLEQQSQKQEQKRRQEKRRQELVQKEQEKLRLELLQQEKLEQEKLEQERQRQQKQQRQEQEKLERQRQELEQQIQVESDLGTLPVNQAVDDRIDVVSVSSTSSFSLSTSTPKLGPEPKPVAEIQTTAHRPAESEPEPLAMDNVDAQQPMHQPAVIFTTNGSSKSNGKQPITIDSILANVEAPAEAVADSVNPEIEAQTVRAQAINKTALDIDESISLTSNITTLLLTSALVFDGGSQVADQLDSVLAVNLDQAIKLAQSIINGRPASEQNIYP